MKNVCSSRRVTYCGAGAGFVAVGTYGLLRLSFAALMVVGFSMVAMAQTITRISSLPIESSSFAIVDLDGDGYNDIIVVGPGEDRGEVRDGIPIFCGGPGAPGAGKKTEAREAEASPLLYVYVFDGSAQPPYSRQLAALWPRLIGQTCDNFHPTVAVGDINFDGRLDVLVGGYISEARNMFAFQYDGNDVPGWESVAARDPPFFNAPAIADVNADGAPDALFIDESCYLLRNNSLGVRRQCKLVTAYGFASPAVGDLVNAAGQLIADHIPDEITAGDTRAFGVAAYSSFGHDLGCDMNGVDFLRRWSDDCAYTSSPALHDLDGDGTQEAIIQCTAGYPVFSGKYLRVFPSNRGTGGVEDDRLPYPDNDVILGAYSSPAVADLDGDGVANEIVLGTDSGHLIAWRYDPLRPAGARLVRQWESLLDTGYAISSSPLVVDLDQDGLVEIVTATNGGRLHISNGQTGSLIASYDLLNNEEWTSTAAIYSTPAIGSRRAGDPPTMVAANRRGIFTVTLTQYPSYDPAYAPWPTFHANNARTGSYPFGVKGTHGSAGGTALACTEVQLRSADCGRIVRDYYGGEARAIPKSDGRFVFELLFPGDYCVRYIGNDAPADWTFTVSGGSMSYHDVFCR